jgi:hypothetical protein
LLIAKYICRLRGLDGTTLAHVVHFATAADRPGHCAGPAPAVESGRRLALRSLRRHFFD